MKYQTFMRKIMQQLGEYKGIVDHMATFYLTEKYQCLPQEQYSVAVIRLWR